MKLAKQSQNLTKATPLKKNYQLISLMSINLTTFNKMLAKQIQSILRKQYTMTSCGLFQECKAGSNIRNPKNTVHHIHRTKGKIMITSIDEKKKA